MATQYTTAINSCRVHTQGDIPNVVKEVNVTITGTDDVYTKCVFALPIQVTFGPADPQSFIPFDQITEAEMIEWVNAQTDQLAGTYAHIDLVVQKEVALAELEPKPLPWSPPTPPDPAPVPPTTPTEEAAP